MSKTDLTSSSSIDTSKDSIVIANLIEDLPGGRSLDVSAETETVIKAGRVILQEDGTQNFKPLAISGGAYVSVPSGHTVVGISIATVRKDRAMVGIMTRGTVNEASAQNAQGLPAYTTAIKDALPFINFRQD